MSDPKDQKIAMLEQQVHTMSRQIAELAKRLSFLERENGRRKQDVNILARKG
jgi:hypothetical protein